MHLFFVPSPQIDFSYTILNFSSFDFIRFYIHNFLHSIFLVNSSNYLSFCLYTLLKSYDYKHVITSLFYNYAMLFGFYEHMPASLFSVLHTQSLVAFSFNSLHLLFSLFEILVMLHHFHFFWICRMVESSRFFIFFEVIIFLLVFLFICHLDWVQKKDLCIL